jgi:hypothetical protein
MKRKYSGDMMAQGSGQQEEGMRTSAGQVIRDGFAAAVGAGDLPWERV